MIQQNWVVLKVKILNLIKKNIKTNSLKLNSKAKIRRLYDIASVLTSIGLIKKYHFTDVNISKPAYMYVGPNVDIIREAESEFSVREYFKTLKVRVKKFF